MKRVLHWFWAPIREGENWAQTLVRVLGNLFRIALTMIVLFTVGIASTNYLADANYRAQERLAEANRRERALEVNRILVEGWGEGDARAGCSGEYPVSIKVENTSSLALVSLDIEVTARIPGRSTNVLGYAERRVHWDHIVLPETSRTMCYRVQRTPTGDRLVYSAAALRDTIDLQPVEGWMADAPGYWSYAPVEDP